MSEHSQAPLEYATAAPRSGRGIGIFVGGIGIFIFCLILVSLVGVGIALFFSTRAVRYQAVGTVVVGPVMIAPHTPSRLTLVQRTTQPLPGSDGSLLARIGDITGGQVLFTLEDLLGQPVVNTVSMRPGNVQGFIVGIGTYEVELVELKNFLTGDDFAVFEVREAGITLSEEEKIRRLIDAVAAAEGINFIRNGVEHSAADAAEHLARKYEAVKDEGLSARQFIARVASRSSTSGQAYRVRLPDGSETTSEQWLGGQLRRLEAPPASPATQPSP